VLGGVLASVLEPGLQLRSGLGIRVCLLARRLGQACAPA
jgi:hypothetical protein